MGEGSVKNDVSEVGLWEGLRRGCRVFASILEIFFGKLVYYRCNVDSRVDVGCVVAAHRRTRQGQTAPLNCSETQISAKFRAILGNSNSVIYEEIYRFGRQCLPE